MLKTGKKVFTTEAVLQADLGEIGLCLSAYSNCILVVISQTGSVGSILRGEVVAVAEQDHNLDDDHDFEQVPNKEYIYEQKVLFGSTELEFYDLLMRKILELIFEAHKFPIEKDGTKMKVILNVALRVTDPHFNQATCYQALMGKLAKLLPEVL